mgnify:FL=1
MGINFSKLFKNSKKEKEKDLEIRISSFLDGYQRLTMNTGIKMIGTFQNINGDATKAQIVLRVQDWKEERDNLVKAQKESEISSEEEISEEKAEEIIKASEGEQEDAK